MRYFFEAGSFTELSWAELISVFEVFGVSKDCIKKYSKDIYIIDNKSIDVALLNRVFGRLGGFIRYGQIIDSLDTFLEEYVNKEGKLTFGISSIGNSDISVKQLQKLSNDIKRYYKSNKISSRFVIPKKDRLNAAQVINNHIVKDGFELCILNTDQGKLYGKTLGIQDLNSFVDRDLGKPGKDYDMGVLPHKLARIMCNLAKVKEGIIWDPFCGSGTVLMEAAMLGLDVLGSDIDYRALENSQKNIQWLSEEGYIGDIKYNIFGLDIYNVERKTLKELKRTGIKAVICEPFMGPPQVRVLSDAKANELLNGVKRLYSALFNVLDTVASKGFTVVMVLPSYKTKNGWKSFSIREIIGKKWDINSSGDLKWERNNSIIARNIFVLNKR